MKLEIIEIINHDAKSILTCSTTPIINHDTKSILTCSKETR
jgi:hypothetical protein